MPDSTESLHNRLERLNRASLPREPVVSEVESFRRKLARREGTAAAGSAEPLLYRRGAPKKRRARPSDNLLKLEEAVAGNVVDVPGSAQAYVVEMRLAEHEEDWTALRDTFRTSLDEDVSPLRRRLARTCEIERIASEEMIFIDIETTGLAGTPVFLIGTMTWENDDFVLRQYFARDYAEEGAILSLSAADTAGRRLLVSFNGKSFDVPYLRMRAAAKRMRFDLNIAHFDLLYECRRDWRGILPDCRLQTLESYVCHRPRHDDIPGHEIPEAYHAFVRTGDATDIVQILRHNALDLITLADLMTRLRASTKIR